MKTKCIIYDGYKSKTGYCLWKKMVDGKRPLAHRFVYEQKFGKIQKGLTIDHLCKTKNCINVEHMEVVTLTENIQRALIKQICIKGHQLSGDNLYLYKTWKFCRKCRKYWDQQHPRKQKQGIRFYV